MAFPTVAATNTGALSTAGTSHTINMPASISAGDLLLIFFVDSNGSDAGVSFGGGFTKIGSNEAHTGGNLNCAYKIAAGGDTCTVTTTASIKSCHTTYRITGWHGTTPPEKGTAATAANTTPDPPNLSPSWGADDTLWIEFCGAGASGTCTAASSGYTNLQAASATGGSGSTQCLVGTAEETNNTASENPGTMTISASLTWGANVVAVRPAAGGGGTTPITKPFSDTWQNTSDSPTFTVFMADHGLFLPDDWDNLADTDVTWQLGTPSGTTPIDKNFPADAWGNEADQAPVAFRTMAAQPAAESLNNWADTATAFLTYAAQPAADSLNVWADNRAGFYTIGAQLAESLNNWADSPAAFRTMAAQLADGTLANWQDSLAVIRQTPNLIAPFTAETLNNWLDQTVAFETITAQFAADSLSNWTDVVQSVGILTAAPAADSLNNWLDSRVAFETITAQLSDGPLNLADTTGAFQTIAANFSDAWQNLADSFTAIRQTPNYQIPFTDNLNSPWLDPVTRLVGDHFLFLPDTWGNLADAVAFLRQSANIQLPFTDAWQTLSDSPTFTTIIGDHRVFIPDAWATLADSVAWSVVSPNLQKSYTDSLNNWAEPTARVIGDYLTTLDDTWGTLADQVAVSLTGAKSAQLADTWQTLADQANAFRTLAVRPTDSLNNWTDQFAFIRPTLTQKLVPITDTWGNLTDQSAVRLAYLPAITDDLDNWLDDSQIIKTIARSAFPEDANNWLDQSAAARTFMAAFIDPHNFWQDQAKSLQTLTLQLSADDLNNWQDQAPQLRSARIALFIDTWGTLADSVATTGILTAAFQDNANTWQDQAAIARAYVIAFQDNALNVIDAISGFFIMRAQATDDANKWMELIFTRSAGDIHFAPLTNEPLNNWLDTITVFRNAATTLADTWQTLADSVAPLRSMALQIPADPAANWLDSAAARREMFCVLADNWSTLADQITAGQIDQRLAQFLDAAANFQDQLLTAAALFVELTDDASHFDDELSIVISLGYVLHDGTAVFADTLSVRLLEFSVEFVEFPPDIWQSLSDGLLTARGLSQEAIQIDMILTDGVDIGLTVDEISEGDLLVVDDAPVSLGAP